jgi:hypothetical protein
MSQASTSEREPWSGSSVLRLTAEFREALRTMRAVDRFNSWLLHDPAARANAAVQAALGLPSNRISTLAPDDTRPVLAGVLLRLDAGQPTLENSTWGGS